MTIITPAQLVASATPSHAIGPMHLLLIRYALPARVAVVEGFADPDLDPRGHAQALHSEDA